VGVQIGDVKRGSCLAEKELVKVPNHTRTDMRISIGFAASFFVAFLVTILAPEGMTWDQIEAIWTVAISAGFINHGIWDRESGLVLGGSSSIAATLISLAFAPTFFPVGWIVLGFAIAVSGFYHVPRTEDLLVGVYIALGGFIRLVSVYLSTSFSSAWMVWMVLVGLMIMTVAMESENHVMRFTGASCILVSVVSYTFFPELMFLSVALVFAVGMPVDLVYLYRLLGRTPKIGEIFSFATRALFLHGLKKPMDQYRVLAILIKGNIGAKNVIDDLMSRLEPRCAPILLLGPTAPTQLIPPKEAKIGWVTTISGVSEPEYPILSPEDPSMVSVFLNKTLETMPKDRRPVILGDFLDNMIPHMDESLFYKYYSDLASAARILNYTVVFVVKADIHREVDINVVKHFADVIIENREREEKGRLVREVRVSNRVDNIYTDWEKY
jgi:hypothetical protein